MLSTTIVTTLLTGAAIAAALPSSDLSASTLERRACQIQYPSNIVTVFEDQPNINTVNNGYVFTAQNENGQGRYINELQFNNIPAGAFGCSVEYFFPRGARVESIAGTRLDFFVPDRNISTTDTWVNRPGKSFLAGTQIVTASAVQDTKLTVVTSACSETLNYIIEVEGTGRGSVGFSQFPGSGLRLTYNC